jgi:hypothetical protein
MLAGLALVSCLVAGVGLASPDEVAHLLDRLGDVDLAILNDPANVHPVRVLVATKVSAPADKVRAILTNPASYRQAMPSFRRADVVASRDHKGAPSDKQVAWELEVPLWNLTGKLWLHPQGEGVELTLLDGDFAPGLFHLSARRTRPPHANQSILTVEGFANVRDANMVTRQLTQRSPVAEPAMTVAAAYVMLKALAIFAEQGKASRPTAPMSAPAVAALQGGRLAKVMATMPSSRKVVAAVRSRPDGRLLEVDLGVHAPGPAGKLIARSLDVRRYGNLPGWKKMVPVAATTCKGQGTRCWQVESNLPMFSLDGTLAIAEHPWRARMVEGDCAGAVLGMDVVQARGAAQSILVLSQHPRLDQAGYVPRKLIAAEPLLEQGLALALTMVEAIGLAPALASD